MSDTRVPVIAMVASCLLLVAAGFASGVQAAKWVYQTYEPVAQMTSQVVPRAPEETPVPAPPTITGKDRVNILLLGSDTDAKFAPGSYLTQIMIIVTIDPIHKSATMVSIPRDFWVQIPGYGYYKVGTAYELGGVQLARATVEKLFGITIHYYAWVGLEGFVKVVDALGGVSVDVLHPVTDDTYPDDVNSPDPYAYMRLYIPAGPQHLDGTRALQYVRSRHGDLIGDFGRSQRQQQVLTELRRKAENSGLLSQVPALIVALKDDVRTDLSPTEIIAFGYFAQQISQNVTQVVLSPPRFGALAKSPDGQDIVQPDWKEIRKVTNRIFAPPELAVSDDDPERVKAENATVLVENGTNVPGLAARVDSYLAEQGFKTLPPASSDLHNLDRTRITVYTKGKPATVKMLTTIFGVAPTEEATRPPGVTADIVITLGASHANFAPAQ